MAFKRFTVFSRIIVLLLLLVMPRCDPSSFSAQPGRSLILDPGVSSPLCFSAQSGGWALPDPGLYLSLLTNQELADSLCDLSKCYVLSICLLAWVAQVTVWPYHVSYHIKKSFQ